MALSLGVAAGSKIQIGESIVHVDDTGPKIAVLHVDDGPQFVITEYERTEILPSVYCSFGASPKKGESDSRPRLAFEAPRYIKINRIKDV